jgi:hypothetical protein
MPDKDNEPDWYSYSGEEPHKPWVFKIWLRVVLGLLVVSAAGVGLESQWEEYKKRERRAERAAESQRLAELDAVREKKEELAREQAELAWEKEAIALHQASQLAEKEALALEQARRIEEQKKAAIATPPTDTREPVESAAPQEYGAIENPTPAAQPQEEAAKNSTRTLASPTLSSLTAANPECGEEVRSYCAGMETELYRHVCYQRFARIQQGHGRRDYCPIVSGIILEDAKETLSLDAKMLGLEQRLQPQLQVVAALDPACAVQIQSHCSALNEPPNTPDECIRNNIRYWENELRSGCPIVNGKSRGGYWGLVPKTDRQ